MNIIKLIASILILFVFVFSKVKTHEHLLFSKYKTYFEFIQRIISPVLGVFDSVCKPFKIGNNVSLDTRQFVLLAILIFIINF